MISQPNEWSLSSAFVKFLILDSRPTFVFATESSQYIYRNPAFDQLKSPNLITECQHQKLSTTKKTTFQTRLNGSLVEVHLQAITTERDYIFGVIEAVGHDVDLLRMRMIPEDKSTEQQGVQKNETSKTDSALRFDRSVEEEAEYRRWLYSFDWSSTPLGPIHSWSKSLRTLTELMLTLPDPIVFYAGPKFVTICNLTWKNKVARERHDKAFGKPFIEGWPEGGKFVPILEATLCGESYKQENVLYMITRQHGEEETYFDIVTIPAWDGNREWVGAWVYVVDKTPQVVWQRSQAVIEALLDNTSLVLDIRPNSGFWNTIISSFNASPHESPFIALYSCNDTTEGQSLEITWKGGLGFAKTMTQWPDAIAVKDLSEFAFGVGLQKAIKASRNVVYTLTQLERDLLAQSPSRGYGHCDKAVIIPIISQKHTLHSLVVLGLNHKRPYDEMYRQWVDEAQRIICGTVNKGLMRIDEAERIVELERNAMLRLRALETTAKLAKTRQELKESEMLFSKIAASIPVGLAYWNTLGGISWKNDAWDTILGMENADPNSWRDFVMPEDLDHVDERNALALKEMRKVDVEFRTIAGKWCHGFLDSIFDEEGTLTGYYSGTVDINDFKMAEEYQRQLTTEAVERKRQQDNFIDVTSHELRNPLSAIVQSADEVQTIALSLKQQCTLPSSSTPSTVSSAIAPSISLVALSPSITSDIDNIMDAAATILLCAEHQKTIINDILTVSKMDAGLLKIEAIPIMPHKVFENAMKMFATELRNKRIDTKMEVSSRYQELCGTNLWMVDNSRLTQILLNLLTNAIKFTAQKHDTRRIDIAVDASLRRPVIHDNPFDHSNGTEDESEMIEFEDPNNVYIHVHVKDTGIGISKGSRANIGERFQQVPKTHINYGGSGLGLYIGRNLSKLLGGDLYFSSELGVGSTFSFFIRAQRAPAVITTLSPNTMPRQVISGNPQTSTDEVARKLSTELKTDMATNTRRPSQLGYKILVVEDNILNQRILRKQLVTQGCITEVANNGLEAFEMIKDGQHFDVVLMDMEMPVMNGVAATQNIRQYEGDTIRHVPIIGTSANARVEHIEAMKAAGMDDVITKPFLIKDLLVKIDIVLENLGQTTK